MTHTPQDELVRKVAEAMHDKWMSTTTTGDLMWPELSQAAVAVVRAHDAGQLATVTADLAELRAAFLDALDGMEDMRAYVPDYFAKKWDHGACLTRARAVRAAFPDQPEELRMGAGTDESA